MRSAENIEKIVKNLDLDIDTNAQTDQAVLSKLLDAQTKSMKQQPAVILPNIRKIIMKNPITKLAAAAVIIIAVFIGIDQLGTNGSSVVWADVAERFESVPFFNITAYFHKIGTKTKKIEIWRSEDSRIRAHEGNKVFFKDFSKDKNEFTELRLPPKLKGIGK